MLNVLGAAFGVFARQVHGSHVALWPEERIAHQARSKWAYLNGDALVTEQTGHALIIQVADCQSVLIADPVRRIAANVHSGWRGSLKNVVGSTVAVMASRWRCRPEDFLCGIGPSLGPCCAEFVHYRQEFPEQVWRYQRGENHFDFWQMSVDQLLAAGVRPGNIEVSGMCTKCNQHLFYSYRGSKQCGRFATLIGWSPLSAWDHAREVSC